MIEKFLKNRGITKTRNQANFIMLIIIIISFIVIIININSNKLRSINEEEFILTNEEQRLTDVPPQETLKPQQEKETDN